MYIYIYVYRERERCLIGGGLHGPADEAPPDRDQRQHGALVLIL